MSRLSDAAVARISSQLLVPALPPRYQPITVIGRGGMGVVWRAHDHELDRDVAVKVLAEHVDGPGLVARLRRESRILARLEHPGVVAVHDAGVLDDGRPWYVMRLVRGQGLDTAAVRLTRGDQLRVMARLAETIAFAHDRGVVHRDLTPRNIMLGPFGEVLVLDWGVARESGQPEPDGRASTPGVDDTIVTDHGTVLGTPGYMAPEQAAGLPADHRSDIHGLGAILRDLLDAGGDPVPPALAAIRDRALAPDPAARYPDPLSFRDDLERFQDGEPVSAHRERLHERLGRIGWRYRTAILLVTGYLLMRLLVLLWRGI